MNRRTFLTASAAAGLYTLPGPRSLAQSRPKRVAVIGPGWYGKCDLFRLMQVEPVEVVALADPDSQMLAGAAKAIAERAQAKKPPATYKDYRDMLAKHEIDLALIATPDHWHALAAIDAMKAGADLYLQKPISVDIVEGQSIVAAAQKYNRVVQVGTQRRSTPHLIEARDRIIKEGKLGKIGVVEIYCYYHMRANANPPDTDPPPHLDWDLWTGPAPLRPYNKLAHPGSWRAFMEYGNGIVGDMCIHMLDMVRWMLGLGWPEAVSSEGGILVQRESKANIPDTQIATFDYGDLKVIWKHRSYGAPADPDYPWGATFFGDKGTLKAGVMRYDYIPMARNEAPVRRDVEYELEKYPEDKTEPRLERHVAPAIRIHMKDLLDKMASRGKPVAHVEEGHISTATCVLANMSLELGRSLTWDPVRHQVVNDAEANKLLRRPYRSPYLHPEPNRV
ncbi:MAG: Gfo/Idh/MocA family oxidoreductase [Bryobacteraceae bacterium]|nr:Gfo/Idh/MocA family oxidoreductase [Bryobacteraceae bacterium]